ncbi:hypothetical protein [Streptomyces aidingensis]|uniref:Uncharacterized protein n=1 Tax=Streptomyces aidingensis TaxID=910347 RepID=A0A1I1FJ43_9ACTN|nr:hypothetical protein [Streptomyces aidingensis]SFB97698.1 hypothetical protein SAMN05421773_101700 [Streptomyces aidingensis]
METAVEPTNSPARTDPRPGRGGREVRGPVIVLVSRVLAVLALAVTLLQAALAGLFVTGDVEMLDRHRLGGTVLSVLVLAQLLTAVLLWRRNRRLRWPMAAILAVVLLTALVQSLGDRRLLGWHMPIGMAICAAEAALVCWAFLLRPARHDDAGEAR